MDHGWLRSIVAQCRAGGVPVFVKQDSASRPGVTATLPEDVRMPKWPEANP